MSDSTTRTITWDEENRMVMLNDDGYVSRYTYDFSGTRVIKSHGPQESVYINGAEQGLDYHDADNYTLYVSPYLIVSNERFTKHYYAGTQRIASKVGSGDFYNVYGVNGFHLTAGDKDYKERLEQIEEGVKEYYNANGIPPGEPTRKGSNADPYVADVALPNVELGDYSVPTDWPTNVKFNEPGDVPGPVVQFEDDDQGDVKAGYGFESDNLYEGDWFFFHTDHLGSTSYLTDTAGNVSQFVCYTPYGEAIVDEHLTTYENPFKFSGKELDDITGLYDHGARSRNPVSTLWYGVDPLWEDYPEMSPYAYCHGNPVRLTDPTGMFDTEDDAKAFQEKNNICGYVFSNYHSDAGLSAGRCAVQDFVDGGTYYEDDSGTLCCDLPGVVVKGNSPTSHNQQPLNNSNPFPNYNTEETGWGSYNNVIGSVAGGVSSSPNKLSKVMSSAKEADYFVLSEQTSKVAKYTGKAGKGLGTVSMIASGIGCGIDLYNAYNSNESIENKIMKDCTSLGSTIGSIGGGYVGTSFGAALGVETGPGCLATAALGGYLGTELGEKLGRGLGWCAGWVSRKVYQSFIK